MNGSEYNPANRPKAEMVRSVKRAKAEVCRSKPMARMGVSCSQRMEMDRSGWMNRKIDSVSAASVVSNSNASRSHLARFGDSKHSSPTRIGTAIG